MEQNDTYNKRVGVVIDEGVVEIEYHKPVHESGSANGLGYYKAAAEQWRVVKLFQTCRIREGEQ